MVQNVERDGLTQLIAESAYQISICFGVVPKQSQAKVLDSHTESQRSIKTRLRVLSLEPSSTSPKVDRSRTRLDYIFVPIDWIYFDSSN
jgi:hypothetical protein